MGKGKEYEYQWLWMFSGMMFLAGLIPYFTSWEGPLEDPTWFDIVYSMFLLSFLAIHITINIRWRRFGHNESILYILTSGSLIGLVMLKTLYDLELFVIEYGEQRLLTDMQWFGVAFYSFLPPVFLSLLYLIFTPRDLRFENRRIRLPVSRFDEWRKDDEMWIDPKEIIEVYPRWTLTIKEQVGKMVKRPVYGAGEKGGYGFRSRDGRRFGYEFSSRIITDCDLKRILGEEEFRSKLKDHSHFTDDDWSDLRKKVSHWYSRQDGYMAIIIGIGAAVPFIQAIFLIVLGDMNIWMALFMMTSFGYFGPMLILFFGNTSRWIFVKGTVFRMIEMKEEIPEWLKVKENMFRIRK